MLDAVSPTGTKLGLPENVQEDTPSFTVGEHPAAMDAARDYYEKNGYVVLRGLIPKELCAKARAVFTADVRDSKIPVLRQKNMRYERHDFDGDGFLRNPIFNVQDLGTGKLGNFRNAVLDIITHKATRAATAALLRTERTRVIQSMFFEAPAGTWAHQDSYYQDSAEGLGLCVAGWYALEDVDAGAGRFYVCPGSHRSIAPVLNEGKNNFATGHLTYQQSMLETIKQNALGFAAPYLAAGDVLFWNSLTVHGSLPASRPGVSRTSLTAHYLREPDPMLQFHTRIRDQKTTTYNGMTVSLLHDQDKLFNKLVREIAYNFPKPYMAARVAALRTVLAARTLRDKLGPAPAPPDIPLPVMPQSPDATLRSS